MSHRIQILPENLANQIAAGEVVERPASVVKELVENSLDASATEIFVDVEKGGRKLIRVTDNGIGMSKDDAFLCLERHATSKISSPNDLFALHTMGFRGEALPAIASVSRLRLTTRTVTDEAGWQIYAEGGTVRQAEAIGAPTGTVIEVRDLFFNAPARRKFLRKEETEFGHIADVLTRIALARPDIHVRLTNNGRTYLEAYRHQNLAERAAALLGRNMVNDLLPVEEESGDGEMLLGLIASPGVSRSSTNHLFTYVNGRFVRDRVLHHAVLDAYRSMLEKRRYPVAVLFLDLPPERVDVNVHPTKHEVRFRDQRMVHDFIFSVVRRRLQAVNTVLEADRPSMTAPIPIDPVIPTASPPSKDVYQERVRDALQTYNSHLSETEPPPVAATVKGEALQWRSRMAEASELPPGWRLIGQYLNSYLVCQSGEELILIDQHAAHERIGFERLRVQLAHGQIESQSLLFPVVMELDHREAAIVAEALDEFTKFGFEIEAFGGRSFTVKAVPQMLAGDDVERLVRDVAAELNDVGRSGGINQAFEKVLMLLACHGMIRAGKPLSMSEMQKLLVELAEIDFGSCCPHGRPLLRRFRRDEVEKFFHRL